MKVVGPTGGIGSGKSTTRPCSPNGAVVVDADEITREVQRPGTEVFDRIVERFGPGVVQADGSLDRKELARLVFEDQQALRDLTGIVHLAVGEEVARRLGEHSDTDDIVVLDIPLLVESGRTDTAGTIVVDLEEDEAVRRLCTTGGSARRMPGHESRIRWAGRSGAPSPTSS